MSCSRFLISFSEKQCRVHGLWLPKKKRYPIEEVPIYIFLGSSGKWSDRIQEEANGLRSALPLA